jgi:hypothetical protein
MLDELEQDTKPTRNCKNCRYFCAYIYELDSDYPPTHINADWGECRRFPPKTNSVSLENNSFPIVEKDMWCGEFDF